METRGKYETWVDAITVEPTQSLQVIAAKKADPDADVNALEAEIDQLVYSLYGLTREQIAMIEASLQEKTGSAEGADDPVLEPES